MRLFLGSLFVCASFLACAGSETVVVVSGDGGAGDASTSSCTVQPDSDRAQLCGSATTNTLFSCPVGTAPPSAVCTKALLPNSFCCTGEGLPADGGKDTGSGANLNPYGVPYPTDHLGLIASSECQVSKVSEQNRVAGGWRPASAQALPRQRLTHNPSHSRNANQWR